MGVGKSAAGRNLAHKLRYEFVDTDKLVEARAGCSVAELFDAMGEQEFRERETEALLEALSVPGRVISTGGGLPLREANRTALGKSAAVVLLSAAPEVIMSRVRPLEKRPLLTGFADPLQRIKDLLVDRSAIYQSYDFTVDTSHLRPYQVAEIIKRWYLTQEGFARNG